MTKESKLQVERKIVEVLGDLYGTYTQVQKLEEEDLQWMEDRVGFNPNKKSLENEAGGLNDDWPVGRGVFIQDQKDFVVLVNFEEHIKIIVLKEEKNDSDTLLQGF